MDIGVVHPVNIDEEMRDAYLDYAMSVIVARALPDARDGLKPVHRRILYAMHELGIRPDTPHKKSARIVGEVLGKFHPHGDMAVYEAMVRMAQDFSMRYPLVDGQGNFGSIDGDGAAAMRYTEARMAAMGVDMLTDISKDTVNFDDNFDGSLQEPVVLPASVPNLLVNGSSGIAVGMSTSIPPHNLGEVCDALVYMLQNWAKLDDISIPDLMQFIQGPDFPTGGIVYRARDGEDGDALQAAYAVGRGKITVRAKVHLEDMARGRSRIIISELPYQTNKTNLIERIAEMTREGRLDGIADLRDESDRQGLRIVIEIMRTAEPTQVLADLFKYTPLQTTFSIIMLALVNGEPRTLSLKQTLRVYLDHRLEIIKRRSEYDLTRAKERAHILEGLLAALDNLDEAISIIRRSRTVETARNNLRKAFNLTEIQAQAILDMQLRRLAGLERKKIQDEHKEKIALIRDLERLLKNPKLMREALIEELRTIQQQYGDPRRTVIIGGVASDVAEGELLMPDENTWLSLTTDGLISRSFEDTPPRITTSTKTPPRAILASNTTHTLYMFTVKGEAATIPVQQLPQTEDLSDGTHFADLCPLARKNEIVTVLSLPPGLEDGFLFLAATDGNVKRLRMEDLPGLSANSFPVMNVGKGASLGWVFYVTDDAQVILMTAQGQAIRFAVNTVRPTGLRAGGMRGIKLLGQRDQVIGAGIADDRHYVWVITDTGVAKYTPVDEYPTQGRAGSGVITIKLPADSMGLAAGMVGRRDDNLVVVTDKGKPKYMRVELAPRSSRNTVGDYVISMRSSETVHHIVPYVGRMGAPERSNGGEEDA
ncbi:MAG: DNA gyrase subunit A [Anaerolineae bacterium]|nr:DNA gyrase subunit A [Anaerolineae bacterium]